MTTLETTTHLPEQKKWQHGDSIFGTASTNFDTDWFKFSVAEGESIQVTIDLTAFAEGSPMDPIVYLYDDRIFTDSDAPYRAVRNNQAGENINLDPVLRYTVSEAGEWGVLIKNNGPGGSDFHWYVSNISLEAKNKPCSLKFGTRFATRYVAKHKTNTEDFMKYTTFLALFTLSTACTREEPKPEQGELPTDTGTEEDTGGVVDCDATLSSTPSIELPHPVGSSVMLSN